MPSASVVLTISQLTPSLNPLFIINPVPVAYHACLLYAGGPKRRKVTHTTINDRGEEVTEEVWEDTQEASASGEPIAAQHEVSPADSPTAKSPARASEDSALKEQPGQSKPWCFVHAVYLVFMPLRL